MADPIIDHWLLPAIAAPAATDRIGLSTGPGAGGRSTRGDFVWRMTAGFLLAQALDTAAVGPTAGVVDNTTSLFLANGFNNAYGLNMGVAGSGASYLQGQRRDGVGTLYSLLLNPLGGNVGIGVTPVAKFHVKSSGELARLETTTARGSGSNYIRFQDPSGPMSYLGHASLTDSSFTIWNELNTPIVFYTNNTARWRVEASGAFVPAIDNAYAFGGPANRTTVVYSVTSAINTCDEREKAWRDLSVDDRSMHMPHVTEAELRAGLRAIEELGFFQWNDAIADPAKGPVGARWHFGPRAQRVWAIFADEGLCLPLIQREPDGDWLPPEGSIPPAFLCFDEWGEETGPVMEDVEIPPVLDDDGNEIEPARTEQRPTGATVVTREAGNRFGVRIDQLHSLMIAALNARQVEQAATIAGMEARLTALEPGA